MAQTFAGSSSVDLASIRKAFQRRFTPGSATATLRHQPSMSTSWTIIQKRTLLTIKQVYHPSSRVQESDIKQRGIL